MVLALSTGSAKAALKERGDDFYETPPVATEALLRHEPFFRAPRIVWEPACGRGAISKVLVDAGHLVHSTDLVDRGYGVARRDFLMEIEPPCEVDAIVTNPPFKLGTEFAARRGPILDNGQLARVYVFRNRLPGLHRDGFPKEKEVSTAIAFAWFVWDRNHNGPTELRRISWTRAESETA